MSVSLWVWSSRVYAVLKRENKWRWPACQPYCLSVSSFMKFKAQCLRLIQVLHEQPKPLEQVTVLFHCDAPKSPHERPVRTTHDSLQLILAFGPVHRTQICFRRGEPTLTLESAVYIESSAKNYSWRKISKNDLPMDQKSFQRVKPECVLVPFRLNF